MSFVAVTVFILSQLSDSLYAEKGHSVLNRFSQQNKVTLSSPIVTESINKVIRNAFENKSSQNGSIISTLSARKTSPLSSSRNVTTKPKIQKTVSVTKPSHSSTHAHSLMNLTTVSVVTTKHPATPTKDKREKNLIILYSTVFSVVAFVLLVIIGVIIVGCRRSEIKGAFKFSQQVDHQLGTFDNNIPRAKCCNSRGNNVVIKETPTSHDGVANGGVSSTSNVEMVDGPVSLENTVVDITSEGNNKSIENKAYDNTALDPDEESS